MTKRDLIEEVALQYPRFSRRDAEVIHIDPREHKMGLSIKALRRSEERAEMEAYLKREREEARFSFEDILREELLLDKEEGDDRGGRRRG